MFAAVGRKQVELDKLNVEYTNLLAALDRVVKGEVHPSTVKVDMAARSWQIGPPQAPQEPPTSQPVALPEPT